ncbi:succinate dehydrogenase, hydrophobic membrane anchor protein [Rickettsiaceae bacterium]|nr:succinate dehydrogenase, hydrophobic membrane anchor protein [Rickettsiaceae bacterium]
MFRSNLSKAKNLGSSGSGSGHWWHQRFTAIIMVLSVVWLFSFSSSVKGLGASGIIEIMKEPCNIVMLTIFIITAFYHSVLGMQVVIEDYISCRAARLALLLMIQIFSIVTVTSFIVAIIYMLAS